MKADTVNTSTGIAIIHGFLPTMPIRAAIKIIPTPISRGGTYHIAGALFAA